MMEKLSLGGRIAMLEELLAFANERQGEQKPTDKVEPKFHEGDWVVLYPSEIEANRKVVQISRVERCQLNMYWTTEGTWFGDGTDARLWTIEDAKDGDVIFDGSNILLVKEINHWHNVTSYLAYSQVYGIREYFISGSDVFTPATKEQRNLLFSKMKEGGYEWDTEMKELKTIEQKPKSIWHDSDTYLL